MPPCLKGYLFAKKRYRKKQTAVDKENAKETQKTAMKHAQMRININKKPSSTSHS